MKYVGKNIPRNDGFDKATGLGQFTMDVSMPHMLYARVLRSPYAHAKVVKIDTSAAEALPGVVTVCTFENTTNKPFNTSATMVTTPRPAEPVRDQTIFTDEPKYIGDEVAAVADKPNILLTPKRTAAASVLPPAIPADTGMNFFSCMETPSFTPNSSIKRAAAR